MYYTEKIEMPKNAQEGIANFVQMIINDIEAGNTREALLKAVDLKGDLVSEIYQVTKPECEPTKVYAEGINTR